MHSFIAGIRSAILALVVFPVLVSCASEGRATVAEATPSSRGIATSDDADTLFAEQRWAAAVDAYRARLAANENDGLAWHHLGYSLHVLGRIDEALIAHERAATFPAQRAAATYNVGCAQAIQGRRDAALTALESAVSAGFGDLKTMSADSDLRSLRDDPRWAALVAKLSGDATGRQREFDFWLGDWDVFDPAGNRVGGNVITKEERGFLIHEHWTDARGRTGQSMNFVDPVDGLWKQVWIDDSGSVTRYSGSLRNGAMTFEGTRTVAPGKTVSTRGTFTPASDGSVRQVIEDQRGDGTWVVGFDGKYVKRAG